MSYDLLFQQAIAFHQSGELNQAENIYRQLLEVVPHNPDVLNLLGLIAQSKNIHQEAVDLFYQAIQNDNSRPIFYFNLGISLHFWNKPYEALQAFEKSSQLDSSIKETWLEIGKLQQELQQQEKALQSFQKALDINPDYIDAHICTILTRYQSQPMDKIEKLQALQQQYPQAQEIDFQLALAYNSINDTSTAFNYAKTAAANLPDNTEILILLGQLYLEQKDTFSAYTTFQHALSTDAKNVFALINLANIECQKQNYSQAETHYKRAIELDASNFDAHLNYGTMLYHTGQTGKALDEYRQAIIINPQSSEASNNLGLILKDMEEFEEALGLFFNAHNLNPQLDEISINLSETLILYHNTNPTNALNIAQNWSIQYPDNTFAQHTFAALQGTNLPNNENYAQKLFDNFAANYDNTILKLNYTVPQKITDLLGNIQGTILDLGCGTGLLGAAIKRVDNQIIGVDISEKMLTIAKSKNIYSQLIKNDIITYLTTNQQQFAFIVAADVFCYFSDLSAIIKHCSNTPLCFSVETGHDTSTYNISPNGRYKHSPEYIKQLLIKYGYHKINEHPLLLRTENGKPVEGIIFVARP